MPQKRIEEGWRRRIYRKKADDPKLGAKTIHREFEREEGDAYVPSVSTIQRVLNEPIPSDLLNEYRYFRWPDSLEQRGLPWEAGVAGLELLYDQGKQGMRPPMLAVKWFWRVTRAIPDADTETRLMLASQFMYREVAGGNLQRDMEAETAAEGYMAFAPWRSEWHAQAYRRVIEAGLPEFKGPGCLLEGDRVDRATTTDMILGVKLPSIWTSREHWRWKWWPDTREYPPKPDEEDKSDE